MRSRLLCMAGAMAMAATPALAAPSVGDKAPSLKAGAWLNLPEGMTALTKDDLKGRIVIVDFWATW